MIALLINSSVDTAYDLKFFLGGKIKLGNEYAMNMQVFENMHLLLNIWINCWNSNIKLLCIDKILDMVLGMSA